MIRWIARAVALLAAAALLAGAGGFLLVRLARRGVGTAPSERLWTVSAPGSHGNGPEDIPGVEVFLPAKWHTTGAGMVILPGGAYKLRMSSYEGRDIARWLNSFGVAAFVLKYRVAPYRYPAPFLDATRAMRYVRFHAARFGIRPDRVGIIGFSAGGHLASTVITHFDEGNPSAPDAIDRVSSRPDFAVLAYPIITLHAPLTHTESVANLLGPAPDPALVEDLSNDRHVTPRTPPTFLFHTNEDQPVPAQNSVLFYSALRNAGVPCEIHIYETGPHGAGLGNGYGDAPRVASVLSWSRLAEDWLARYWLPARTYSYSFLFRI